MTVGETFTWLRRVTPIGRVERQTWERVAVACLFGAAILFPIAHRNDGDIDAAANALTFAALALGLNIVVGLAGLLDLGYAAFFAIGAYTYGVAASWQLTPEWTPFWEPF
jgi:branched-chain amino acid transport system permease protein